MFIPFKNMFLKSKHLAKLAVLGFFFFVAPFWGVSQNANNLLGGYVSGNFQMDAQFYTTDSAINAIAPPEKLRMNTWANINYSLKNFNAGLRFESYLNPLNGFSPDYKGTGIPYWFVDYRADQFQVTAGSIYDQFGNGLIFRTYEEHNLGVDNSLRGVRVKFNPYQGVELKGIWGTQRHYWEQSKGILRGADLNLALNDMVPSWADNKLRVEMGGSFISKYEDNEEIRYNNGDSVLVLPLNVSASAGRLSLGYGDFNLAGEYAYKINDPNAMNNYIYRPGQALFLTGSYSRQGLGVVVQAKRLDNMYFKSERDENTQVNGYPALDINFLPAINKQQTYTLAAMYPYATQPNGEMGIEGEVTYKIKKGTWLGGAYGTDVSVSFSQINNIDTVRVIDAENNIGYESNFWSVGDELYFRDFNLEIAHKFSKNFKGTFSYMYQKYNLWALKGPESKDEFANINVFVADMTYKFSPTHSLRGEVQTLFTKEDEGDWAMLLFEYSIAPQWFFTASDLYNFGNEDKDRRFHYPLVGIAYNNKANRIALSYGKQREGIVCVGGVCRVVPASNGVTLSITSSF